MVLPKRSRPANHRSTQYINVPTWYSLPSGLKMVMCRSKPAPLPLDIASQGNGFHHVSKNTSTKVQPFCKLKREGALNEGTSGREFLALHVCRSPNVPLEICPQRLIAGCNVALDAFMYAGDFSDKVEHGLVAGSLNNDQDLVEDRAMGRSAEPSRHFRRMGYGKWTK